jgi:hypothetical protein
MLTTSGALAVDRRGAMSGAVACGSPLAALAPARAAQGSRRLDHELLLHEDLAGSTVDPDATHAQVQVAIVVPSALLQDDRLQLDRLHDDLV